MNRPENRVRLHPAKHAARLLGVKQSTFSSYENGYSSPGLDLRIHYDFYPREMEATEARVRFADEIRRLAGDASKHEGRRAGALVAMLPVDVLACMRGA